MNGGAKRDRTADLLHAMQALSQLSYGPDFGNVPEERIERNPPEKLVLRPNGRNLQV
jgi:hypothetical protein